MERKTTWIAAVIVLSSFMLAFHLSPALAREWRPSQIPNGLDVDSQFGGCVACHVTRGGGDARNAFGLEVEKRVTVGGFEEFWDESLALLDSDGDGFTNGQELQDPQGLWEWGFPNPGDSSLVSNPGDPNSTPPVSETPTPTPTPDATPTETPLETPTPVPDPTATPTPTVEPMPDIADAFTALLTGEQAVPSVTTTVRGVALLGLNAAEDNLHYRLYVRGAPDIFASHIHLGAPGQQGGIAIPLSGAFDTFVSGNVAIDAGQVATLRSGGYYVNVHTDAHTAGEIRGQVVDVPLTFEALPRGAFVIPSVTDTAGLARYTLTLDDTLTSASWTMREAGLQGITASHIHTGAAGVQGGVVVPLTAGFSGSAAGNFNISAVSLIDGLFSESLYVNIHTPSYTNGEVRDQVRFVGGEGPALYVAVLRGENENPPVDTAARGVALIRLDASRTYYEFWLAVRHADNITMAHIHRGGAATNGPVVQLLAGTPFGTFVSGAAPVGAGFLEDLDSGLLYVNVHTSTNPSGALRGALRGVSSLAFRAQMDGFQHTTPVASPGRGSAEVVIEPTLRVGDVRLSVSGLSGITLSHFHIGHLGEDGGVTVPLTRAFNETAYVGIRPSPVDIIQLLGEGYYVNVHTRDHPGGEIRGQLGHPEGPRTLPVNADMNGDGRIDAADLLLIVEHWHN